MKIFFQYYCKTTFVFIFLIFIFPFSMSSCKNNERDNKKKLTQKELKEPLINVNKHVVKTEEQHIIDFINRYQWPVLETGSGLRYYIYNEGSGPDAKKNNHVKLNYTLRSITGDIIYTSEKDGSLEFQVGKGQVPGGIEEGILLLRVGDKAKFIIPSHLGYGLLGDDSRIPPKATLIYDIELVEIK